MSPPIQHDPWTDTFDLLPLALSDWRYHNDQGPPKGVIQDICLCGKSCLATTEVMPAANLRQTVYRCSDCGVYTRHEPLDESCPPVGLGQHKVSKSIHRKRIRTCAIVEMARKFEGPARVAIDAVARAVERGYTANGAGRMVGERIVVMTLLDGFVPRCLTMERAMQMAAAIDALPDLL